MTTTEVVRPELAEISPPSRIAEEGEGVGLDEVGLAARNHGMPLELMQHDVTPVGAHYLLTHYDIPLADGATGPRRSQTSPATTIPSRLAVRKTEKARP